MAKNLEKKNIQTRTYIREFVNSIIGKDYANANANLTAAVRETLKANVANVLQETP